MMRNPLSEYVGRGYGMIVLVSLIVLLRRLLVSTIFAWCIPTSLFIHFYTCFTYFVKLVPVARMGAAPCHHVLRSIKMASCLVARHIDSAV